MNEQGSEGTGVQLAQAAEPVGKVETVKGTVIAKHADGSESPLDSGDPVYQGDEIRTGPEGAVGIVFVDKSTFSLAEDARMTLDELVYDPAAQDGVLKASLVQGVFSFISGQIAKTDPDAMTIATPMATIGIRGTTGAINLPAGQTLTVVLTADAGGTVGEISVFNAAGVQILSTPFQATQVAGAGLPPSVTFTMTVEEFNSSFGAALAFLPPSPAGGGQENGGDEQGNGEGEGDGTGDGEGGQTGEGGDEGDGEGDGEDGGLQQAGDGTEGLGDTEGLSQAIGEALSSFMSGFGDDPLNGPDEAAIDALTQQISNLIGQYIGGDFLDAYIPDIGGNDDDEDDNDNGLVQEFDEVLTATTGNDSLVGGDSNTEFVMAQSGTTLPSGTLGGTDTVNGGGGTDQITFDNLNQVSGYFDGTTSTLTMWGWSHYGDAGPDDPYMLHHISEPAQATITFSNMEQLYFGSYDGSADAQFGVNFSFGGSFVGMAIAGGSGNDIINWNGETLGWFSTAQAVLIFGGGGDDEIHGGDGANDLQGGDGNDILHVTSAGSYNSVTGGAGSDTLTYNGLSTGITATLTGSQITVAHGGTDSASGIESLVGSNNADIFNLSGDVTSFGLNNVSGNEGDDTFNLTAGTTFSGGINGGLGNDTVNLGASQNTITVLEVETVNGGAYQDTITVQDNSNSNIVITGGTYSDTLSLGGNGSHTVRYTALGDLSGGADVITSFNTSTDSLLFNAAEFLGDSGTIFSSGSLVSSAYFDSGAGMASSSGATVFFFQDTSTGKVYYDADGNDGATAAVEIATVDTSITSADITGYAV